MSSDSSDALPGRGLEAAQVLVVDEEGESIGRDDLPDLAQEVEGDLVEVLDEIEAFLELLEDMEREGLIGLLSSKLAPDGANRKFHGCGRPRGVRPPDYRVFRGNPEAVWCHYIKDGPEFSPGIAAGHVLSAHPDSKSRGFICNMGNGIPGASHD